MQILPAVEGNNVRSQAGADSNSPLQVGGQTFASAVDFALASNVAGCKFGILTRYVRLLQMADILILRAHHAHALEVEVSYLCDKIRFMMGYLWFYDGYNLNHEITRRKHL